MKSFLRCLTLFVVLFGATELSAVPRNPPPVFESAYTLPETSTPVPCRPVGAENLVAVILYAVFLLTAIYAAYTRRSRRLLFGLAVVSVVVLGFVFKGCPCPVGMFQNIVDAFIRPVAFVPWTVLLLFLLPLLTALFYGRVFCSSVCPLGAVQELTAIRPVRIPDGIEQALGLLRYFWLGLAVFFVVTGLGYLVCRFDPYVGLFRLGGLYSVMVFSGLVLILGLFVGRPFCRFLCPYGALLGLCAAVSAKKVSVTPGDCTKCRLCEDICPYNAIRAPSVEPTPTERRRGPRRLAVALLALPVLVGLFALIGYRTAPRLAAWHHDVRTAELLLAEDRKLVDAPGTFPETRAVIQVGTLYDDVYRRARSTFARFRTAGFWLGAWVGAVLGLKLVALTLRRRRTDYEVDPARCVACGRCFWYCPNQQGERLLLREETS